MQLSNRGDLSENDPEDKRLDGTSKNVELGRALALLFGGQVEEGLELYRKALKGDHLPSAPVGLHLQLLRGAGHSGTADRLLAVALREGANVAVRAGGFGADPAQAAAEYEELFGRGIVNSRMVHEHLLALSEQNRADEVERFLAPSLLLHTSFLRPGQDNPAVFAGKVEALLLDLQDQAEPQDARQSIRRMHMLKNFDRLEHPVAQALMASFFAEVQHYLAAWRASGHPLAHSVPSRFDLGAWGLVSHGEGYNERHIHAQGWATGVYYPTTVTDDGGGHLVIGPPAALAGKARGWHTRVIRPEAGLLVLIPSFYMHWTVPLGRPGLRTSIAFDVLP
jgi:hypothetical protein